MVSRDGKGSSPSPKTVLAEEESAASNAQLRPHATDKLGASAVHVSRPSAYVTSATYASAGLANMISATTTNPFDVVKLRQQLLLEKERANFLSVARGMLRTEGVKGLWAGVTAACLREGKIASPKYCDYFLSHRLTDPFVPTRQSATYGTIRMGGYEPFKRLYTSTFHLPESSFALKLLAGVSSGTIGCLLSSPTDLMKVRMQAVRDPAMEYAPPYRSTLRGFVQVYKEEGGVKGLWRGVGPNVARAGILTASQVGTYDQTKWWLKGHLAWGEGGRLHLVASMVAVSSARRAVTYSCDTDAILLLIA